MTEPKTHSPNPTAEAGTPHSPNPTVEAGTHSPSSCGDPHSDNDEDAMLHGASNTARDAVRDSFQGTAPDAARESTREIPPSVSQDTSRDTVRNIRRDARRDAARVSFSAFDTNVELILVGSQTECAWAAREAQRLCERYERLFSRTLADSDVSRMARAAGEEVPIASETAELIDAAKRYCARSRGTFDITIGAVTRLWDFKQGIAPDQDAARMAARAVDWRCVEVREIAGGSWVGRLTAPATSLDLGGIAKGWIADELKEMLEAKGIPSFVIDLGGNVVAHGRRPEGGPWIVGIRNPFEKGRCLEAIPLRNSSIVTSGVYERSFRKDGRLLHHILDPRTGYPARTDLAAVSVIAKRSLDAEGFSSTLLALGEDKGAALARTLCEVDAVLFVRNDGSMRWERRPVS